MFYIWLSCVLALTKRFQTMFKTREICNSIQVMVVVLFGPVNGIISPLLLVALTSRETLNVRVRK